MSNIARACKQHIAASPGGYRAWYAAQLGVDPATDFGRVELRTYCPFHKETATASFQANTETGLWNCFGGCSDGGDLIKFYHRLKGHKRVNESIYWLALELGVIKEITDETVQELHENLFQSAELVKQAEAALGVPAATLREYLIGATAQWEKSVGRKVFRYTIPIKGETGHWEDIRKYHSKAEPKILHWAPGHGAPRVYPRGSVDNFGAVTWLEGEKDTLRALSLGVKGAFTITAGAGVIPEGFPAELEDKVLYICLDVDPKGIESARKVASACASYCKEVYLVHLPPEGLPANGDFSDWCNLGNGIDEWKALLKSDRTERVGEAERKVWQAAVSFQPAEPGKNGNGHRDCIQEIKFSEISQVTNARQEVEFEGRSIAIGAGMQTYYYPKIVEVRCDQSQGNLCKNCPLKKYSPDQFPIQVPIDPSREESLQLVQTSTQARTRVLREFMRIPDKCMSVQVAEVERASVRQVVLTEPMKVEMFRTEEHQPRLALYSGPPIQSNRNYKFRGRVQLDPKSQKEVLNLHEAFELQTVLETFRVTDDVREAVRWFQHPGLTVSQNLERVLGALEMHTGISGRIDLVRAYCQSIYSAARLDVGGKEITPAVGDIIVVGDPATAKSTLVKRMLEGIMVGHYIDCSTVSRAGLVGGIETVNQQQMVKWGILPQNHLALVVFDEAHEFVRRFGSSSDGDQSLCEGLRNVRSNGVASITKISGGSVACVVRMIWITNPAKDRGTKGFAGAVRSLPGLFPSTADQRRFTALYAVSVDDVTREQSTKAIARKLSEMEMRRYHHLAVLVWSLGEKQIHFTEEAIEYLQREAVRLARKYYSPIPLLGDDSSYEKLCKLVVSIAALCGSFEEVGEWLHLVVRLPHAQETVSHLERNYDSQLVGYYDYALAEGEANRLRNREAVFHHVLSFAKDGVAEPRDIACFVVGHQQFTFPMYKSLFRGDTPGRHSFQYLLHQHALRYVNDTTGAVYATPEFLSLCREILAGVG